MRKLLLCILLLFLVVPVTSYGQSGYTLRSFSANMDSLQSGLTGNISAENLRDAIASLWKGDLPDSIDLLLNSARNEFTIGNFGNTTITTLDSLGIGTATPEAKLHVSGGVGLYDSDRSITSLHHIVDKKYVDEAVTALGARYYMLDTNSGTADYKLCSLTPSAGAEQDTSMTSLSNDDYILGWISPNANEPEKLITGVYNWRFYAEKTAGTETLRLYWKLVERKSDTSEVIVGTSVVSNEVTSGKNSYIIPLTISADHDLASDSYVVGKLYADVSGSGSAPSITLYYEGNSTSHWDIPVNTEILDGRYVNADGDTMTGALTVLNNIQAIKSGVTGFIKVGSDDAESGAFYAYGDDANIGGQLVLWNSLNEDTNYEYYDFWSNGDQLDMTAGGNDIVTFYGNGNFTITGTTATKASGTTWAEASDIRIKQNIADIQDGLEKLRNIRPVSFNYTEKWVDNNPALDTTTLHRGFVADELETTLPKSVGVIPKIYKTIKQAVLDSTGKVIEPEVRELQYTDLKTITTHDVNVLAIAAIKELDTKVQELEERIEILEANQKETSYTPIALMVGTGVLAGLAGLYKRRKSNNA